MPSAPTNGPLRVAREKPDPAEAGAGVGVGAGARPAGLESKGPQGSEVNVARLRVLQLRPSCQSAAAAAAASPPTLINRCDGVRLACVNDHFLVSIMQGAQYCCARVPAAVSRVALAGVGPRIRSAARRPPPAA